MYTLVTVLIFIVCLFLVLIVLVQNSKGGGLSSSFSSSNQVMGVKKTTDFLEKGTWYLAGFLLFLCIVATAFIPREAEKRSAVEEQIENVVDPSQVPNFQNPAVDETNLDANSVDTNEQQ